MREEGEEEEEEGSNDECTETECKAGDIRRGTGIPGSDQLGFMAGDGVEDKALAETGGSGTTRGRRERDIEQL